MELIRHRGDQPQAKMLEQWLAEVLQTCGDRVLDLDGDAAQIWGRLQVPNPHNAIDKQIAAIALGIKKIIAEGSACLWNLASIDNVEVIADPFVFNGPLVRKGRINSFCEQMNLISKYEVKILST